MKFLEQTLRYLLLGGILCSSLNAQWVIKPKKIRIKSKDEYVFLFMDFPVLVGEKSPRIRKAINYALGQASKVDDLIKEAKVERLSHEAKSQQTTTESDDDEDFSWSYDLNYSVGMNNKSITSIGLNFGCQVGGAVTGHSYFVGCTYNNKTGTRLSLNDILLGDYDSKLRILFVKYLTPISGQLSSEWKTSIQDVGFEFYISSKGIVFPESVIQFPEL